MQWMRMVCRSDSLSQRILLLIVRRLVPLIVGIPAEYLLADRGYDSNEIIEKALAGHCCTLCQA